MLLISCIHAASWVVICAAKYLNLQFPAKLITQRSVVHPPPQPTFFIGIRARMFRSQRKKGAADQAGPLSRSQQLKAALAPGSSSPMSSLSHRSMTAAHVTVGFKMRCCFSYKSRRDTW